MSPPYVTKIINLLKHGYTLVVKTDGVFKKKIVEPER
jgi:hypothetical protein